MRQSDADFGIVSYTTACELLNITPAQKIIDGLQTSVLSLKYRSLGPVGAKALAAALMVSILPQWATVGLMSQQTSGWANGGPIMGQRWANVGWMLGPIFNTNLLSGDVLYARKCFGGLAHRWHTITKHELLFPWWVNAGPPDKLIWADQFFLYLWPNSACCVIVFGASRPFLLYGHFGTNSSPMSHQRFF